MKSMLLILYITLLSTSAVFAQDLSDVSNGGILQEDPIGADSPGDPPIDPGTPVDGGLSLLLAAGVIYGGRKLMVMRKNRRD